MQQEQHPYPPSGYAWYVVIILTIVYVFSFIDRQILNLMVQPIRRDLGISDTQMSLLMGFSFAVFYTVFGLPLGRLIDQHSRRATIAVGFAAWSLFTAGCGVARNFTQMLLMRMGVGVGEASLSPAAYSIIADYFPPHRRATAMSVYSMGIYLGSGLAFLLGGLVVGMASGQGQWSLPLIGEVRPWQVIFFAVGLPGVPLALLMLTIREPERRGVGKAAVIPIRETAAYIWENRATFLCHNVGFALLSFSSYGTSAWVPTMFVRNHGWTASQAGVWYGTLVATMGTLGIVVGGWLADWFNKRGHRDGTLRVGIISAFAWLPTGVAYPLVSDPYVAIALLAPTAFLVSFPFGAAPAAIQQIMPNPMRGQASAVYLFVVNMIGLGLGPTAIALLTDKWFHDDQAVRYSILIVGIAAHLLSGALLITGLRHYRESLDRLKRWEIK